MKLLILLTLFSFNSFAFDHSHKDFNNILGEFVSVAGKQSSFDYKGLIDNSKSNKLFNGYLKTLSNVSNSEFKSFSADERLAFLINSYNAFTIKIIIKNYPVKSIKDIGSLFTNTWAIEFFHFLGEKSNLDNIEHNLIRKNFNEPRIHFAVNCASIGCPSLLNESFVSSQLEAQLSRVEKNFFANKIKNSINTSKKVLHLSKIFKWYGGDFEKKYGSLKKYVSGRYNESVSNYSIEWNDYNWKLNMR